MTDYDFATLNDKEFEVLCTDLISLRDNVRYERFKPGRDAGVDGRFFRADGGEVILQCKHWVTAPLERLVKHLQTDELPKLAKLNVARYVLALSHPLARTDKARIEKFFKPHIHSASDVLGREDLNDLLARYPEVERRHYKLWIGSSTVLKYLLNKPIHDRSSFAVDEILIDAKLYVPTKNHDAAIEKLERLGSVIITGPAGIGKTTLADHLALHYITKGFTLVRIADEIREAESVYEADRDQVFYFDDFLGRNYLEALTGHEGAHIVQFIKRVGKDRKKRFILTSRTTILNQGKLLIDVFQTNNLDKNEFEVTLSSFSEMDRARVLYNHMWHSTLGPEYIDVLYQHRRYREVIRHQNYNPRLIRYITDSDRLINCPPVDYWNHAKDLLDYPAKVWENPFEAQHDDFGRAIVLLVTLNGRPINQSELAEAYARFVSRPTGSGLSGRHDFLSNLKHLSGSLLSRTIQDGAEPSLNLFNPSIGDFVLHRYATDIPSLRSGFESLRSVSSLNTLSDLASNDLIEKNAALVLIDQLLQNASQIEFVGYSAEYIANACLQLRDLFKDSNVKGSILDKCLNFVLNSECPHYFQDIAELIQLGLSLGIVSNNDAIAFVEHACAHHPMSTELEVLGAIVSHLGSGLSDLETKLEEAAVSYLANSVDDEFSDGDVFESVEPGNTDIAEENLRTLIDTKLSSFGVTATEAAIDRIVEAFGIRDRMETYFRSEEPDDDYRRSSSGSFHIDEIDDLFERPT